MTWTRVLLWVGVSVLGAVAAGLGAWAWRDIRAAYARLDATATHTVATFQGTVEYLRGGDPSGLPVLVIHGSGGGYDQGALVAQAVLGEGVGWIAPSRFGYLRSTFRPGATFQDQAHAYAALLDHLGLRRVAVVALSHGGPSALWFAALYPQRVASLTLLSCGVASSSVGDQAAANRKGDLLTMLYRYDTAYWAVSRLLRGTLTTLMGADPASVARLAQPQRRLVDEVIDGMLPVAPRSAGVSFDHQAAMPNEAIAAIRAPTLIVHARDDGLQLFHNGQYAADTIPGAQLLAYDHGGHLLIAVEQGAVAARVRQFIRAQGV